MLTKNILVMCYHQQRVEQGNYVTIDFADYSTSKYTGALQQLQFTKSRISYYKSHKDQYHGVR